MRTTHLSLFLAALLWLGSCINEPLVEPGGGCGDGRATRVTLAVKGDSRQMVQPGSRSLTPEQEGLIDNLHILVFDDAGDIITNEHFARLAIKGTGSVSFETLPGADRQMVVIANGDVNDDTNGELDAALRAVATLNDLKTLLVTIKGNGLARTDRLTMVGSTTVTINKPHAGSVPIALHFLAAKVTVSVKDNLSSPLLGITITGWDVVNIPKQTFLHERTGDEQQDAVTGTRPGDYLTTAGKYNFEQVDAAAKTWSQSFYVFENRRGSRVDRELPTNPADRYPGMGKGDGNQRGKAWYAPPGATYMLIYGTHTPQDGQTNNIVYKIYLGENAEDDYNLFRGRHYGYNVTINGLDDINVDTNVEWGSASFSVDTSDNLLMDAHPDFRVFRIGGTAVNATTMAYATVEVLEPDGLTPCTWLTVSPLNLYRHGIKQAGNDRQQFAPGDGIGSFVRAKYTPTPTTESTLANSSFGMTRRLTRISFEQPAVYTYQHVILYAAALDVPETERRGKVKITYYKGSAGDEVAGQLTFEVSQQGAIQVSSNLYMERYEESGMLMHPGLASGLQGTEIMQWGYDNALLYAADDRYSNGNYLTANAVYNTVKPRNGMEAPVWVADNYAAYREKYPHQGERVREPSTLPLVDGVYYYPALESSTSPSDYFHPVFNSSAARYCHEKNRDTDGDGVISKEETVWYLPSYADMWYITKNMPTGLNLNGAYWTSTEVDETNSWAYSFPAKTGTSVAKSTPYRVRCVRGTGTVIPDATIESTETDKTKINLACTIKSNGAFTVSDETGIMWTVTSSDETWLKVATATAGKDTAVAQSGVNNKTLYAYATKANISTSSTSTARTAKLTLSRSGMKDINIEVIQAKDPVVTPLIHNGWAGCSIYWEPDFNNGEGTKGRLTFDDIDETTHKNCQGVYFQFGSLVALSSVGAYTPSVILFSPAVIEDSTYSKIPNTASLAKVANRTRSLLIEVHDPSKNIGDICQYITERGWGPGAKQGKKWRMPTSAELDATTDDTYTQFGSLSAVTPTDANGLQIFPSGYTRGAKKIGFPAAGRRNSSGGAVMDSGTRGFYWSSSPSAGTGYMMYLQNKSIVTNYTLSSLFGMNIRCVLE